MERMEKRSQSKLKDNEQDKTNGLNISSSTALNVNRPVDEERERETIDNRSTNNEQITFVRVAFFSEGERLLTDLEQCHYLVNPPRARKRTPIEQSTGHFLSVDRMVNESNAGEKKILCAIDD